MLKLEDFKLSKLNNITLVRGGETTISTTGSSSGGGSTSHDIQKEGDSNDYSCEVDDNTAWGDIEWQTPEQ